MKVVEKNTLYALDLIYMFLLSSYIIKITTFSWCQAYLIFRLRNLNVDLNYIFIYILCRIKLP
jgi:hypothetical protein